MESLLLAHVTGGLHAAVALVAVSIVVVGAAAGWVSSPGARRRVLTVAVVGGMGFQLFHLLEHVAQLGYWFAHPLARPWLTPWAAEGRDVLAVWADGRSGSGSELLHLVGNLIFLAALVAALRLRQAPWTTPGRARHLRVATWVQSAHVAEHALLTTTWFLFDRALGVSTLLGLVSAEAATTSISRVWFHFGINLVATVFALRAGLLWAPRPSSRARGRQEPAAGHLPA